VPPILLPVVPLPILPPDVPLPIVPPVVPDVPPGAELVWAKAALEHRTESPSMEARIIRGDMLFPPFMWSQNAT
jgi:hypothetical protein